MFLVLGEVYIELFSVIVIGLFGRKNYWMFLDG